MGGEELNARSWKVFGPSAGLEVLIFDRNEKQTLCKMRAGKDQDSRPDRRLREGDRFLHVGGRFLHLG